MPKALRILPRLLIVASAAIVLIMGMMLVLPRALAEEGCELIDNQRECIPIETESEDLCPNIDGMQTVMPSGYRLDDKTGDCVESSVPQVLSESVVVPAPDPQVLGESIGK